MINNFVSCEIRLFIKELFSFEKSQKHIDHKAYLLYDKPN